MISECDLGECFKENILRQIWGYVSRRQGCGCKKVMLLIRNNCSSWAWIVLCKYFEPVSVSYITKSIPGNLDYCYAWWRQQMETFSALLAICAGNSPVPGESPAQRPVTRNFDVFFDLRLIKQLSKQSRGWSFETLSHPLWRHRNGMSHELHVLQQSLGQWLQQSSLAFHTFLMLAIYHVGVWYIEW